MQKNLELVKAERNEVYISNAALLFSSSLNKKQIFPYAKIECARFKGRTTSVMIDQQTIDCPVYAQPEKVMKFIILETAVGYVARASKVRDIDIFSFKFIRRCSHLYGECKFEGKNI